VIVLLHATEVVKVFRLHTLVGSFRLPTFSYCNRLHCVFTNHSPRLGIINNLDVVWFEIGRSVRVSLHRRWVKERHVLLLVALCVYRVCHLLAISELRGCLDAQVEVSVASLCYFH
jgi:hypothetical protein